jgi:hypothetical protein
MYVSAARHVGAIDAKGRMWGTAKTAKHVLLSVRAQQKTPVPLFPVPEAGPCKNNERAEPIQTSSLSLARVPMVPRDWQTRTRWVAKRTRTGDTQRGHNGRWSSFLELASPTLMPPGPGGFPFPVRARPDGGCCAGWRFIEHREIPPAATWGPRLWRRGRPPWPSIALCNRRRCAGPGRPFRRPSVSCVS